MTFSELETSETRNWAMAIHLVTFAGYIIPFGNIIIPLIIWMMKKEGSEFINEHGKAVMNFQISFLIWFIISGILCFVFIGFFFLFVLVILEFVYTIINAVRASDGRRPKYPLSIKFL